MALPLLAKAGRLRALIADKAYDANALRQALKAAGAKAVIPSTATRARAIAYDKQLYKKRNLIERMFCRLKDFRRIATRYDKLARNFLAAAHIAAIVTWWI
jgi:transposase